MGFSRQEYWSEVPSFWYKQLTQLFYLFNSQVLYGVFFFFFFFNREENEGSGTVSNRLKVTQLLAGRGWIWRQLSPESEKEQQGCDWICATFFHQLCHHCWHSESSKPGSLCALSINSLSEVGKCCDCPILQPRHNESLGDWLACQGCGACKWQGGTHIQEAGFQSSHSHPWRYIQSICGNILSGNKWPPQGLCSIEWKMCFPSRVFPSHLPIFFFEYNI